MKLINKFSYSIGFSLLSVALLLSACGKQDNYEQPNAGIKGTITDASNQPLLTEQPNGAKIRLLELKYNNPTPIDFWVKADGTFENSNIFSGKYKVLPVEGPFFPVDTLVLDINGLTTANFKVIPFLTITASAVISAGSITITYQIAQTKIGAKITQSKSVLSAYPTVSNTINEKTAPARDFTSISDATVLSTTFTDNIQTTGLVSGQTYYVRIAAKTANALGKYNYSPIMTIKIP